MSGTQLWVSRSTDFNDTAAAEAISPDGATVFVTGGGSAQGLPEDNGGYLTIAYDAATGASLWERRYAGPAGDSIAKGVVVSPATGTVVVTGTSGNPSSEGSAIATVADRG